MIYIDNIKELVSPSLDEFIRIAYNNLPDNKRQSPWIGLSHGVKLLDNENELNQYLCAYGKIHQEKITIALDSLPDVDTLLHKKINLVDWGCGQGLATICFLDYVGKLGIRPNIENITLIEPSEAALERACQHIQCYNQHSTIHPVQKYINEIVPSDIQATNNLTIHFFSNILDIDSVDLNHLADTLNNNNIEDQIFICVGPQNVGASRIEEFAQLLEVKQDDLIEKQSGKLSVRGTISLLIFSKHNEIARVIKVAFQHIRRPNISNQIALQRILQEPCEVESYESKLVHYYRKIIEYERFKSESIAASNCQNYPLEIDDNNDCQRIIIDIQQNRTFERDFTRNFDERATRWPQNLNVGLCIILNDRAYRLLQYVYPQEELKNIDITTQYVSVDLNSFTIDSEMAEELGIESDIVETLEQILSDRAITFEKLEEVLKDAISDNLVLDHAVYLALTSENPALAQIYKELMALENVQLNETLSTFLHGHIENNVLGHINKNTLIHVKDIDKSQNEAISAALNHKFSVITGPPGTGKTQLILNLIANALLYNRSVLVASKNNKAVDNIKDRYDSVDGFKYLLRFGSHETLTSQLVPYLDRVVAAIPNLEIDEEQNNELKRTYKEYYDSIIRSQEVLSKIEKLNGNKLLYDKQIENLNIALTEIQNKYQQKKQNLKKLEDKYPGCFTTQTDYDKIILIIKGYLKAIQTKSKGFKALFFNIFYYNGYRKKIEDAIGSLPQITNTTDHLRENVNQQNLSKSQRLVSYCTDGLEVLSEISNLVKENIKLEENYKKSLQKTEDELHFAKNKYNETCQSLEDLNGKEEDAISNINISKNKISGIGVQLFKVLVQEKFAKGESRQIISRYKNYITGETPIMARIDNTYLRTASDFLSIFKLNTVTNLSVKNAYPLEKDLFDLLVIDEASQCDVASAIPLIYRAKHVVVIGDPLQLKHISAINVSEENEIKKHLDITENPFARYSDYSLWDYCKDLVSSANNGNQVYVLDNHYRCNPQIFNYSKEFFYRRISGINLNIKTIEKNPQVKDKGIIWVDVCGEQESETRNVNLAEVDKSIDIACQLASQYPDISIGIISPFKDQAQEINEKLPEEYSNRINVNTVHAFQGDEKDIIIYSLVVTDNSPESKIRWIDHSAPNLVNVAVTRARTTLYVVGNRTYIHNKSTPSYPLGYLEQYATGLTSLINIETDNKSYIIDTNVLIDSENIIDCINSRNYIIIPAKVIDELEKLKISKDENLRNSSARALRMINKSNNKKLRIERAEVELLPFDYNKKQPDNLILSVALKYQNQSPTLISSDNGLLIKAKGLGIRALTLQQFINNNYD